MEVLGVLHGSNNWLSYECVFLFLYACRITQREPGCADRVNRQFVKMHKHRMIKINTGRSILRDNLFISTQRISVSCQNNC